MAWIATPNRIARPGRVPKLIEAADLAQLDEVFVVVRKELLQPPCCRQLDAVAVEPGIVECFLAALVSGEKVATPNALDCPAIGNTRAGRLADGQPAGA